MPKLRHIHGPKSQRNCVEILNRDATGKTRQDENLSTASDPKMAQQVLAGGHKVKGVSPEINMTKTITTRHELMQE